MFPSWARLEPILDLSWGILGPSWAQDGSSWAHLGPCGGIPEPSGRLREGILRQKQGLEALTWSLHVPRRPHAKIFKNHCFFRWCFKFLICGSLAACRLQVSASKPCFGLKMPSGTLPEGSKMPQHGPRCTQDGPTWAQLGPKMPQHRSKMGPSSDDDGSRQPR